MIALVMDWIEAAGGVAAIERRNEAQAQMLYEAIDGTEFYTCPVATNDRSRMNVVFRIQHGNEMLEKKFIEEAAAVGLSGLKGHRSVGGLRASLYNAQTFEAVEALMDFMKTFEAKKVLFTWQQYPILVKELDRIYLTSTVLALSMCTAPLLTQVYSVLSVQVR